jgi:hypothetical protein
LVLQEPASAKFPNQKLLRFLDFGLQLAIITMGSFMEHCNERPDIKIKIYQEVFLSASFFCQIRRAQILLARASSKPTYSGNLRAFVRRGTTIPPTSCQLPVSTVSTS